MAGAVERESERQNFWRSRAIGRLAEGLSVATQALNAFGTLIVLFLVVAVNADVAARNMFAAPFRGTVELVQFSMVLIVFLQLPDVARVNRLTRSDGLLAVLAARRPEIARFFARMIDTASAIFMGLIAWTMYPEIGDAWTGGDYYGTPGVFTAPTWPVKLAITVSGAVCCLIFALKAITGSRRPELLHLERSGA